MKKIVFTTISMRGGGTERVISVLANYLTKNGYEVTIVTIVEDGVAYSLDSEVTVIHISELLKGNDSTFNRVKKLRSLLNEQGKIDIIAMGTVASIYTVVANLFLKNRIIVSERNDPREFNGHDITLFEKSLRNALYFLSNRIVLQTKYTTRFFPKYLQKKLVVIGNPLTENIPYPNGAKRDHTIISAARLVGFKNHSMTIKAFSKVYEKYLDYNLYIYGIGPEEQNLKQLVNELGLNGRAFLMGFCDSIYETLATGGIFVTSSNSEGLSNSLLEAAAMGIPVIATDCPVWGARDVIDEGINGYVIDVGDEQQLVDRLEQLMSDDDLRASMTTHYDRIRTDYETESIANQWLKAFE